MGTDRALIESLQTEMRAGFAMLAGKLGQFDAKFESKFDTLSARVDQLDAKFDTLSARVDQLDAKFDTLSARVDRLDAKFDTLSARVERISTKLDNFIAEMHEFRIEVNAKLGGISSLILSSERNVTRLEKRIVKLEGRDKPRPASS